METDNEHHPNKPAQINRPFYAFQKKALVIILTATLLISVLLTVFYLITAPSGTPGAVKTVFVVGTIIIIAMILGLAAIPVIRLTRQVSSFFDQNEARLVELNALQEKRVEELKQAKKDLIAANRLKGSFLSNMSHEIRTPLNAIIGFTEILESQIENETQRRYLSSIQSSGEALLRLLNDILDLSKIDAGILQLDLQPTNIIMLFKDIKRLFELRIKTKELELYLDIDPDIPRSLFLDEPRLKQVFMNLLGNAVKFTETGFVSLSVAKVFNESDLSTLDLVFSVQDSGIGIPEDQLQAIFDVFKKSENLEEQNQFDGTGLGLTLSKKLVEIMGGTISVESEVGEGTIFMLLLKDVHVAAVLNETERIKCDLEEDFVFEKASVLIVDDIEANRTLLRSYIDFPTITVLEAENGKVAIEMAEKHRPTLILMDVKMPVMNGWDAAKIIKSSDELKDIPIEIVTASVMKKDEQKFRELCDGFLRKPVSKMRLLSEIKRFLPHSMKSVSVQKIEDWENGNLSLELLGEDVREKLPHLQEILEQKIMVKWEKVQGRFIFSEIEDFAREVKKLGEEYDIDILKKWSGLLCSQVESFNMDSLPGTMEVFPKIAGKIMDLQ